MKQRIVIIAEAVLLVTFVCPEHNRLIMLLGFWPEFAALMLFQRKYYV